MASLKLGNEYEEAQEGKGDYVEAARASEIGDRKMKYLEIDGMEIALANIDGKFYAFSDRCGHMNARLSHGNIDKNIVTCPFHSAKFDIVSGRKISEPVVPIPPDMEPLPPKWQKFMEFVRHEMSYIRTTDQKTFEVKVEGDLVKIKV